MDQIWLAFSIDRSSNVPVFQQICDSIRSQISSGALKGDTVLPPTRSLATELGVSRSTVVTAYDQLCAEGYIEGRQGSGFTICEIGQVELIDTGTPKQPAPPPPKNQRVFRAGEPDMRLFPHRNWAKTIARQCRTMPESLAEEGPLFGNAELRMAIAQHVAEWRGVQAQPEQIIVTAGAGDGLSLCLSALADAGDHVVIEDPGYQPLRRMIQAQGLRPKFVSLDEQGARVPRQSANLAVLTPSHQYPMGGAMTPQRRLAYLNWARANNAWVIEDDYDSEFRFAGRPIPAMAGFDELHRTVYVGSFSKIFSNGMRLGYVIVPNALVSTFAETIQKVGRRASQMPQAPLAAFMNSGEFYRHIRRMRRTYAKRRSHLLECLREDFSEFGTFQDHQAGMQIAFRLKDGIDDRTAAQMAFDAGLEIAPLSQFCSRPNTHNGLLLGFCGFDTDELNEGLETLHGILVKLALK